MIPPSDSLTDEDLLTLSLGDVTWNDDEVEESLSVKVDRFETMDESDSFLLT